MRPAAQGETWLLESGASFDYVTATRAGVGFLWGIRQRRSRGPVAEGELIWSRDQARALPHRTREHDRPRSADDSPTDQPRRADG